MSPALGATRSRGQAIRPAVPRITAELCRPSSRDALGGVHGAWMAVGHLPRFDKRSVHGTPIPDSLNDLKTLSSSLAVRWPGMTDGSRLALIRQIQRVATDLGLETRMQAVTSRGAEDVEQEKLAGVLSLTPRELDVLGLLAAGHSTTRAAVVLGISPATVRCHVKNLLRKLGVHSRLEAVSLLRRDPTPFQRSA
jgi:DNA-binding CsgD family transcriptional regulator